MPSFATARRRHARFWLHYHFCHNFDDHIFPLFEHFPLTFSTFSLAPDDPYFLSPFCLHFYYVFAENYYFKHNLSPTADKTQLQHFLLLTPAFSHVVNGHYALHFYIFALIHLFLHFLTLFVPLQTLSALLPYRHGHAKALPPPTYSLRTHPQTQHWHSYSVLIGIAYSPHFWDI